MSLAVVVLPLVPVITIDPCVRSFASLVRTLGSMTRATSPGRVVPPPRLVIRLRAPVALPARTAAVLRREPARLERFERFERFELFELWRIMPNPRQPG